MAPGARAQTRSAPPGAPGAELAGKDANSHQTDLLQAIERGVNPSWTLHVQIMPAADAANYRFNPFDLTKVWPHSDYPLQRVGRLVLDRNPDNVFAEVEQSAFSPNNFVPGIGPSPDKMLQGRLFAYADAHRYRLGVNHTQLAVNAPKAVPGGTADNYGRDGLMATNAYGRDRRNYEPNSYDGPTETGKPLSAPLAINGHTGTHEAPAHTKDDDFYQAGELYRLMSADEKSRLVANIAGGLSQVSRDDVVEKNLAHFHAADADYGKRVEEAVRALLAERFPGIFQLLRKFDIDPGKTPIPVHPSAHYMVGGIRTDVDKNARDVVAAEVDVGKVRDDPLAAAADGAALDAARREVETEGDIDSLRERAENAQIYKTDLPEADIPPEVLMALLGIKELTGGSDGK